MFLRSDICVATRASARGPTDSRPARRAVLAVPPALQTTRPPLYRAMLRGFQRAKTRRALDACHCVISLPPCQPFCRRFSCRALPKQTSASHRTNYSQYDLNSGEPRHDDANAAGNPLNRVKTRESSWSSELLLAAVHLELVCCPALLLVKNE